MAWKKPTFTIILAAGLVAALVAEVIKQYSLAPPLQHDQSHTEVESQPASNSTTNSKPVAAITTHVLNLTPGQYIWAGVAAGLVNASAGAV